MNRDITPWEAFLWLLFLILVSIFIGFIMLLFERGYVI